MTERYHGQLERDGMPGAEERDPTAQESFDTCAHHDACRRCVTTVGALFWEDMLDSEAAAALGCDECPEWESA